MPKHNPYYDPAKSHHTPTGFCNPGYPETLTSANVKRWRRERKQHHLPRPPALGYAAFAEQWCQPVDFHKPGDRVWFLGHATVLYRLNGRYILTDPVFSQRASPVSFYGPRRHTPAPVSVAQLPPIDIVLISHNHYDHLDLPTLRQLVKHSPQLQCFVPLGLETLVKKQGAAYVTALDWWDSQEINGLTLSCVPARHWSVRSLWDKNRTLWCGWVIRANQRNYYFAGDTAYFEALADIPARLGPIALAALPIGAYLPRWMMETHHTDPFEAVKLHQLLQCQRSFPIHWGVFELSDESIDEPLSELARAREALSVLPDIFPAINIGGDLAL